MVWLYTRQCARHAIPEVSTGEESSLTEGPWVCTSPRRPLPPLHVVALFNDDRGLGGIWSTFVDSCGQSLYWPRGPLLILRPEEGETPTVQGCSVLHEAGHALRALVEGRAGQAETRGLTDTYFAEERDIYLLEARLWEEQNPDVYTAVMADATACIRARLAETGAPPAHAFIGLEAYDPRLDQLLGTAASARARATRKLHFDIQANLLYVEREGRVVGGERRLMEARMLRAFYEHFGFSPRL